MQPLTLTELLVERKGSLNKGITFIEAMDREEFISYHALYEEAVRVLAYLQERGIRQKDELVFQIENNRAFVIAFWACILGGIIPIPLSVGQNDNHRQKLFNIWPILNNPWLIISPGSLNKLCAHAREKVPETELARITDRVVDESLIFSSGNRAVLAATSARDIALVQFSSGSTGSPKGVVLTHENLLTNLSDISHAAAYTMEDATLSWMPLTHDMGLIGFHLSPLFNGIDQYLLPTSLFVHMPAIWISKTSEHSVTILSSPNFGYKYFRQHCDTAANRNWDLSSVRIIYNGAEPISEKLCREFLEFMAPYQLRPQAMCPVYGMAEASVAATISGIEDEVIAVHLNRNKLNFLAKAVPQREGKNTVTFVNVGKPIRNCAVRTADNDDQPVADGTIGHIQIQGANVTVGYYNNPEASEKVFTKEGWLRTGDLGFIKDGALFVTGRRKDIIFVNGQNYYPHDIERVAEAVEGIELNKFAVAGCFNNECQKDEIIGFVLFRGAIEKFVTVAESLKAVINREVGITLDKALPVRDIPRTTSGKLQRYLLVEQYKSGKFREIESQLSQIRADITKGISQSNNEKEQRLLGIWQRVLGTNDFDMERNFFEAGGNSLKAAEVTAILAREFDIFLPADALYENPTVRQFAANMNAGAEPYMPIPHAHQSDYYPVSQVQKRMYYAWQVDKSSVAYNVPAAFSIAGDINISRLERSVNHLIQRHDSLRMSFHMSSEPVFQVNFPAHYTIESIQCSEDELPEKLRSLVQPFNLEQSPLMRIKLLETGTARRILLLDFHHIIADGLSVYNFLEELWRDCSGEELPALPLQYKDYACWEKESLSPEKLRQLQGYWSAALKEELPVLDLPADFSRPVIFDNAGAKLAYEFSPDESRKLYQFAAKNQCTLHVLLFTAYNLLLARVTGQDTLIVGIPVSGRRHPDLKSMIGMFVNNLAISTHVAGNSSFTALLQKMKANLQEALRHQDYHFEKLIQQWDEKRDVSRNFIFDTMFVHHDFGMPDAILRSAHLSQYFFDPGFAKYDLTLEVFELEGTVKYAFEYATKLFSKETIVALAACFQQLLQSILQDPDANVADLPLISEREREAFIYTFNDTTRACPEMPLHRLVEQKVAEMPDETAVDHNGRTISYEALNSQSNDLAMLLRSRGMQSGSTACVLLKRSPELIISILGVLKAGGCFLPVDTDLPEERIKFIIGDSHCGFLITDTVHSDQAERYGITAQTTVIDMYQLPLRPKAVANIPCVNVPDDLAYTIYTSGTTGNPKGVMIRHRSLVNYILWAAENYTANTKACFPLFTSISFDLTITALFTPLITGGTILIYEDDNRQPLLDRIIADNKANVIKLTPSHLKILVAGDQDVPADCRIKSIVVGGEQLESQLAGTVSRKFGNKVDIYNEYGPTETTVGCMIHRFDPYDPSPHVPIGIPAQNTAIYILDKFLQPVPVGVKGELYISGTGVAGGYLNRAELTQLRFLPDPFRTGQRMYKTGDIAKRLPADVLAYMGRYDEQVKLNGYRIEPAEIEHHLLTFAGVTEAVVAVKTDKKDQKNLYAYYKSDEPANSDDWIRYLAERLPHYMIPAYFIRLETIPLTRNGKVDYKSLPEVEMQQLKEQPVPAANAIEKILLQAWGDVLQIETVSVTDNFFELGGDSIKAIQIASRLRNEGLQVQVKDILTYHNIHQISRYVSVTEAGPAYQQAVEGDRGLSAIEEWFFNQHFTNPHYYNQSVLLKLNRIPDKQLLETAFAKIVTHHDGLRVNYNAQRRQMFYNKEHLTGYFVLDEWELDTLTDNSLLTEFRKTFDITKSLLIKAAIVNVNEGGAYLFITAHHLVIDGVSWRILLEDLYTVYKALENGKPAALPPKTATQLEWNTQLAEIYTGRLEKKRRNIPQEVDTRDRRVKNLHKVWGTLDRENTWFLLKQAYRLYKTDTMVLLLTALAQTFRDWMGSNRLIVEVESHGRDMLPVDVSRTVGWFTLMYAEDLKLVNGSPLSQVKAIKEQVSAIQIHEKCLDFLNGKYLFPAVRFNYLGQFGRELNNDLFSFVHEPTGSDIDLDNNMTAGLEINALVVEEILRVEIGYNRKAHNEASIKKIRDLFLQKLAELPDHIREAGNADLAPTDFDSVQLDENDLKALFD